LESQQAAAGAQFTKNETDRLNKVASGIGSKTSNMPNTDQMGNPYKKGGKIKKMNEGGSSGLKDVDAEDNPGLAKLPTNVRNNMGYKRGGGKVKKMMTGGTCS